MAIVNKRKGYNRRADIPPALLRALNEGREESATLAEWLAIDAEQLLGAALREVGLDEAREELIRLARSVASQGIMDRHRAIGRGLYQALHKHRRRQKISESLACHRSDTVRCWAALMLPANDALTLEERLAGALRFATDPNMGVRETAWLTFRPCLAMNLEKGLRLLGQWVRHEDASVRRCAIEATRPRGVWTEHITALKSDPSLGLPLLEKVRSDASRYVQLSAANWLNDASKSRPDWVREVCARWLQESTTQETKWIVHHALRTIRKADGDQQLVEK